MDFEWVAIALGDVVWIAIAFIFGFLARIIGLPPLVGFLLAGFILAIFGATRGEMLKKMADLGITLLLFTVGLKIRLSTLARPQVWLLTGIHSLFIVLIFGILIFGLSIAGIGFLSNLEALDAFLIAFALSFSSTVYVVKTLEEKGEMKSLYGSIAIGILIMQDILAVVFLAFSSSKTPSIWAFSLLFLIPLKPFLHYLLKKVGHGELLVLYGFLLAIGGANIFEMVGMKGDLGALIIGMLMASNVRSDELSKTMLSLKDLFLLGFFLSIGMSGQPDIEIVIMAFLLLVLVLFKSTLFYLLFIWFRLRTRTALLSTFVLSNYSEFGLIVMAIGVSNGWIENDWLLVIAIAISFSFALSSILNKKANFLYAKLKKNLFPLESSKRLIEDKLINIEDAQIALIGMGGIGVGAYDKLSQTFGNKIIGIDIDPLTVNNHCQNGRNVIWGDPSDADFWERINKSHQLKLVMITLPKAETSIAVIKLLREAKFEGKVTSISRFSDEEQDLIEAGVSSVYNIYDEAGAGFASHVFNLKIDKT